MREDSEAIKKSNLHRKVAAAIFFESNGGMSQAKAVATLPEIRAAVSSPDLNLVDIDNVLEGLVGTCYYLSWDRNRYRFGLTPNLNQILVTRRGTVQPQEITDRVKQETQKLFNKGTKALDRRFFAERSNDVPSRPVLTLCVVGLDYPVGEKSTEKLLNTILQECGSSRRTYKSAVLFAINELSRTDEITSGVGANKLVKYWPPALTEWSTKSVRDAFLSSPQIPRLLDPNAIKRTIADGVSQATLGYATKDSHGQLKLLNFNESITEDGVEIANDVFLLKAEDAQKLLEPPRLDRLTIRPIEVTLKPGEQASFTCCGERPDTHALVKSQQWAAVTGIRQWSAVFRPGCDTLEQETTIGFFFVSKFGRFPPLLPSCAKRVSHPPTMDDF